MGANGKKKFKCELCFYSTPVKATLKAHIKAVHERTRDQKCDQCDFAATTAILLNRHKMYTHQGVKRKKPAMVKCEHCDFTSSKYTIIRHMKNLHDNIKDHMCQKCGKGFSTKQEVQWHMEKIHQRRECHQCDFVTYDLQKFSKHKNDVHGKAMPKKLSERPRPVSSNFETAYEP